MANVMKRPRYTKINGLLYPEMLSPKCFQEALEYKPKPGDVFIDTYPKCGTTWMQNNQLGFGYWDGEFDDFFELFMDGELPYNDYFDHLLDWYPHRNDPNVFYTTYEDMKKDIKSVILKLSRFLGDEYIEAIEKDNAVFNNIILYSGFDYMKKMMSEMRKLRESVDMDFTFTGLNHMYEFNKSLKPPEDLPEFEEVRKGIVGDWRNHFSVDQTERLNRKFLEK
ncbi:amine sulfotransferase [Caerostris extrusa]|uniref:Amine sulfotransferase n=1 Tax=Caerostris extrusa TaxID=172846 RepID=A0AAV4UZ54_CAEEX|nr:amine sulfotransferase [Caerostris extrusa]